MRLFGLGNDTEAAPVKQPPGPNDEQKQHAIEVDRNRKRLIDLGVIGDTVRFEALPRFIKTKILDLVFPKNKRSLGIELRVCFSMGHNHPALYWTLKAKTLQRGFSQLQRLMRVSAQMRKDVLAYIIPNCDVALTSCAEWEMCVCDGLRRFQPVDFAIEALRTLVLPDYIWRESFSEMVNLEKPSRSLAVLTWVSHIQVNRILLVPDTSIGQDYPKIIPDFEMLIAKHMESAGEVRYWDPDFPGDIGWPLWWEHYQRGLGRVTARGFAREWLKRPLSTGDLPVSKRRA